MADPAKDAFVTAIRQDATAFWDAFYSLKKRRDEFTTRGWSGQVTDADMDGQNYDFTATGLSNLIGSIGAVETLMDAGDEGNFAKAIKR